jgi:hypothetical protein
MMMEQIQLVLPKSVITDKVQLKISNGNKPLVIAEVEIWSK